MSAGQDLRSPSGSYYKADAALRKVEELCGAADGGLAASLAQIRKGSVALKHVDRAPPEPARQPSGSLASVLRRRLDERKLLLSGGADNDKSSDDEE